MKMPQKQKIGKKKLALIALAVLLVAGGVTAYVLYTNAKNKAEAPRGMNDVQYTPATNTEKQDTEQQKANTPATPPATPPADQKPGTPAASTPTPANQSITVTLVRVEQDGATVNIKANIRGTTSGTCEVTFTKAGQPAFTKTFPVAFEATTSQCHYAAVAASDFPVAGQWNLSLWVKSGSQISNTATGTVDVKK